MGLVSASTTPMLLKLVAQQKLAAEKFATHHFTFDQIIEAYDTFGRAAETKALKVVIAADDGRRAKLGRERAAASAQLHCVAPPDGRTGHPACTESE